MTTQTLTELTTFLEEYTAFLAQMLQDEGDKLSALTSRDLVRIEHSISASQANAKKLSNFEQRRESLQAKLGFADMSFRQIIDEAPDDQRSYLERLFFRFENQINEIRFSNDKSMQVARDNMVGLDPDAAIPAAPGTKPANPYARLREERNEQSSGILKTKA